VRILKTIAAVLTLPILLIVLWWIATIDSTNPFVPRPGRLVEDFVTVWLGPLLVEQVLPSLARLGIGLGSAIVAGIALGVLIGSNRIVSKILGPVLEFIRAVPPPVLLPVLMMLMGIGDGPKVFLIALGCVWPILLNTVDGVRSVDGVLSDTTRTYAIHGWDRLRFFVLPAALPRIMTGIRLALPISIILMVVSEMYAISGGGLGSQIIYFQRTFQNGPMWAGILVLGLLGVVMALLFRWIERWMLAWYYGQREAEYSDR